MPMTITLAVNSALSIRFTNPSVLSASCRSQAMGNGQKLKEWSESLLLFITFLLLQEV
jgi:hypothetical protein